MRSYLILIAFAASSCILSGCGCSRDNDAASESVKDRMEDSSYRSNLGNTVKDRASLMEKRAKAEKLAAKGDAAAKKDLENIDKELDAVRKQAQDKVRARILEGAAKKGSLK